jgi:hypothetical protein
VCLRDIAVEVAATGATCSHAAGVIIENVTVNADTGPAITASDTTDLDILRFRTNKGNAGQPVIQLNGVRNAVVESCSGAAGNDVLVEMKGKANENVQLLRNRYNSSAAPVTYTDGASDSVVTRRD